MLTRVLEPEVMDTAEEAADYDSMDHAEVNRRFVDDFLTALADAGLAKRDVACRVLDLSQSGAAIGVAPDLRPPVGSMVTIGKTPGRVVRHIEDGFAVEFTRLQHPDFLEENISGE